MTPHEKDKLRADAVFFAEPPADGRDFDCWEVTEFAKAVLEFINYGKYGAGKDPSKDS
jgi:hypothetical protein